MRDYDGGEVLAIDLGFGAFKEEPCVGCGGLIDVTAYRVVAHIRAKKYCSNRCKSRAQSRERTARAREARIDGWINGFTARQLAGSSY